eukprot:1160113-Pelagomonas_calceolata.AAC.2
MPSWHQSPSTFCPAHCPAHPHFHALRWPPLCSLALPPCSPSHPLLDHCRVRWLCLRPAEIARPPASDGLLVHPGRLLKVRPAPPPPCLPPPGYASCPAVSSAHARNVTCVRAYEHACVCMIQPAAQLATQVLCRWNLGEETPLNPLCMGLLLDQQMQEHFASNRRTHMQGGKTAIPYWPTHAQGGDNHPHARQVSSDIMPSSRQAPCR